MKAKMNLEVEYDMFSPWNAFFSSLIGTEKLIKCKTCKQWVPPVYDGTCKACRPEEEETKREKESGPYE